ncbi:hypothetical protein [Streptomyces sp. Da 82-17]|uniref:hypothetical protein n=1 Tax=Streptomyces sp. Da 82-17 TaxID=3377116 RepID=UPI0038D4725B
MRRMRRVGVAVVATVVLGAGVAGCGGGESSENPGPSKPAATPTEEPTATRDAAAGRAECVEAWAKLLQADEAAGVEDEPAECAGLPDGDRMDRYMEGLQEANRRARETL